jgi:hypothetical protein
MVGVDAAKKRIRVTRLLTCELGTLRQILQPMHYDQKQVSV